jgi:hypothetical protein
MISCILAPWAPLVKVVYAYDISGGQHVIFKYRILMKIAGCHRLSYL